MPAEQGRTRSQSPAELEQKRRSSLGAVEKIRVILMTPHEGTISQFDLEPHLVQIDEETFRSLDSEDKAMLAHAAGWGTPIEFINAHQQLLDRDPEEVDKAGAWGKQYLLDRYRDTV